MITQFSLMKIPFRPYVEIVNDEVLFNSLTMRPKMIKPFQTQGKEEYDALFD